MNFNYLESFPLSESILPHRLKELLKPVGLSPDLRVEVACMQETDLFGENAEHLHLQMAVVPEDNDGPIEVLREAGEGVVAYSVPFGEEKAESAQFSPSISGYDYIVAAWGDASFYTFSLAEKVWMTLGLTPRCIGNEEQRLIYDALKLPEFDVAEGEVSSEYQGHLKRDVCWKMSNEYLRRYLWLRGAKGVRVFFYKAQLEDTPELRESLNGKSHIVLKPTEGPQWYELDLREHKGGILLQLWASVEAVLPELCLEQDAETLLWADDKEPMTHARANALMANYNVYLNDRFLEKYEQSNFYDTTPINIYGQWWCAPSYKGQWSFTECQRVGRNLIRVPVRELYKAKPDREIVHANNYEVKPEVVEQLDLDEEHIAIKVQRLLEGLLRLGEGLSALGETTGQLYSPEDLTGFSREEVDANGWLHYPSLVRLAQVAPLDMTQQVFLARCKSLHEILQKNPNGFLKSLLRHAGCPSADVKNLGSLKLMQSLLNVLESLNEQHETIDCFTSENEPEGWKKRNATLASLFLNNDLRIADAHDAVKKCIDTLQDLGFDTASLSVGYGRAFDFVIDAVSESISCIATHIEQLLERH
jgi:hypothetical protein